MTRLFDRLHEEGRLSSPLSPASLAAVTIAVMDGLHTQWLFDREAVDVEETVQSFLATLAPELAKDLRPSGS
jgi:hypothetical protein